jgi:tetratricopeptide (TPR) repeat protein
VDDKLKTLKQMILNVIESNPRGYSNELAEIAGYSNGSNLKKVLVDEKKEFDNFTDLLELVKYIWKDDSVKMMSQYSNEVDVNKKTARNLLEYFVSNAQYEAFNNLLDRMDESTNKESKEYAKIYRMQYKYQPLLSSDSNEFNKLIEEIIEIHVTFPELKVYKKMLINYCCFLLQDYNMLKPLLSEIEEEMKLIDNEFIKEMYSIRVNEVKCYTYLKAFDDPETARDCADWIINSNAANGFKAYAYYLKAHSYMFSSYEDAMNCYEKAMELYEGRHQDITEIKEEVEFVKVYWDKEFNHNYVKNELFYQVKKGQTVSLNDCNLEPEFKLFLEGISTKNIKKLLLSMIGYIKIKDLFLANLAKIELIKSGYDTDIITAMVSINAI